MNDATLDIQVNESAEVSLEFEVDAAVERIAALRLENGERSERVEPVAHELPLTVYLNRQELVTLLCSPVRLDYLAVGFLVSEGLLARREDILKLVVDEKKGTVWIDTMESREFVKDLAFKRLIPSGCGRGALFYNPVDAASQEKVTSLWKVTAQEVTGLVLRFQQRSRIYRMTGGVHSAALCNNHDILVFAEDIARHNAVDRLFGECLLSSIPLINRLIITSGRISSEMLLKAARRGIPVVVSKSAPTSLAVKLAESLGVTLIGFARSKRMNVYANAWRIIN